MKRQQDLKVVFLLKRALPYWHPIAAELTKIYPQTKVFTGFWSGFSWGYEASFDVEQVGKIEFWGAYKHNQKEHYAPGLIYLSPKIIIALLRYQPKVIISDGFCIWTVFALLLKLWKKWRVIIICDGSSPGTDYRNSWFRIAVRRLMTRITDAFITNNQAGKSYLVEILQAKEARVFARPYLVPDRNSLLKSSGQLSIDNLSLSRPVFLCVGQIIPRKNLKSILEACLILKQQDLNFTVLIIGEGWEREKLEALSQSYGLSNRIKWLGNIDYENLGFYYQYADVFLFPTLEDIWGMVLLEAMAFGKAIICSQLAGAQELISDGENGFCYEPQDIDRLARYMNIFIDNPQLIKTMGKRSLESIDFHSPAKAAESLRKVISLIISQ